MVTSKTSKVLVSKTFQNVSLCGQAPLELALRGSLTSVSSSSFFPPLGGVGSFYTDVSSSFQVVEAGRKRSAH